MGSQTVMAAARKKWGKNLRLRRSPSAPTGAEKKRRREEIEKLKQDRESLRRQQRDLLKSKPTQRLAEAAKFVADVAGDPYAVDQLRVALESYERVQDYDAEIKEIDARIKKLQRGLHSHRYEILEFQSLCGLGMNLVHASGDTLAELLNAIHSEK